MRRKVCLLLATILLLSGCAARNSPTPAPTAVSTPSASQVPQDGVSPSAAAPDAQPEEEPSFARFTAYDLNGEEVDQSIFAGNDLTMINIWATFCGPCLREMPELGELAQEYADMGFGIVGIVTDVLDAEGYSQEQIELAQSIVEQTGASYPHLLPSYDLYVAKLQEVEAVPETIFVDREGNLVGKSYLGSRSKADWIKIIDPLLAEQTAQTGA